MVYTSKTENPLFVMLHPLILASASPRRHALLSECGLDFQVIASPHSTEPRADPHEQPGPYAIRAARAKAMAVAVLPDMHNLNQIPLNVRQTLGQNQNLGQRQTQSLPLSFVLGADTIVVPADGSILGKPANEDEALHMLKSLVGTTHNVITAWCLLAVNTDRQVTPAVYEAACGYDTARVTFACWPDSVLQAYARCGEPLDKAGGYAIQGKGAFLVAHLAGSWSTVVGLPVEPVIRQLLDVGGIAVAP